MKTANSRLSAAVAISALALALGSASAAKDTDTVSIQAQPAKKIEGPQAVAGDALARAQAKFERALRIVDAHKSEVEASGVTGNSWRYEMIATLMKGSVSDFGVVEGAPSYGEAMTAARRISMVTPQDLGDPNYDLVYVPITPCRVVDTRASGVPVPANTPRTYYFHASNVGSAGCTVTGQIPGGSAAAAFAANVTLDESSLGGFAVGSYLSIYPQGGSTSTSFMNFAPGQVIANAGVVSVNQANGQFTVFANAPTNQIIDTYGVFIEPQATALECVNTGTNTVTLNTTTRTGSATAPACPAGYTRVSTITNAAGDWATNLQQIVINDGGGFWYYYGSSSVTGSVAAKCCRIPGR